MDLFDFGVVDMRSPAGSRDDLLDQCMEAKKSSNGAELGSILTITL